MNNMEKLSASLENYLRAIYYIVKEKQAARVKDISKFLQVGASSASEALKNLSEKGFINYEPYGIVTLTSYGLETSENIIKRHEIIKNFLENVLSIDKEESEINARQIEHGVSTNVLEKFVRFIEFMRSCSCKEPKWMNSFKYYSENGVMQDKCHSCMSLYKQNPELMSNRNCCGMLNK